MKVRIVEYQQHWPMMFMEEQQDILRVLQGLEVEVQHIGSTAVPGMVDKPKIDILVGLSTFEVFPEVLGRLTGLRFTYFEHYAILSPERRFFARLIPIAGSFSAPPITRLNLIDEVAFSSDCHLHVVVKGSNEWRRHIAFREYLRAHDSARAEYCTLKRSIMDKEFRDGSEYNDSKAALVRRIEELACSWFEKAGTTPDRYNDSK
jgi:GrpB-like predicted nucleotidyltransferase (UPF0157 family)